MPNDEHLIELAHAEELRRRYLADQIETATPGQRLLMLFDRLLGDLDRARAAFSTGDIPAINEALVHAQQVLFALRDPLDPDSPLGVALGSIYTYCLERLIDANLRKEPAGLSPVRAMLASIAEANRSAIAAVPAAPGRASFEGVA